MVDDITLGGLRCGLYKIGDNYQSCALLVLQSDRKCRTRAAAAFHASCAAMKGLLRGGSFGALIGYVGVWRLQNRAHFHADLVH